MIVSYAEASQFVANDASLATDANFKAIVDGANSFVEEYCGTTFDLIDRITVVPASDVIVLPLPIKGLYYIHNDPYREFPEDTLETDMTRYVMLKNRITWLDFQFRHPTWLRITWLGGYYPHADVDPLHIPKMPALLWLSTLQIVKTDSTSASGGEQFQSERLGEYSYTRAKHPDGFPYDDVIKAKLDPFVVMV